MLQNNSFDALALQEELSAAESEVFVMESANLLTEAEDNSNKKSFFQKAKEFFIKIAKWVGDMLKKFMNFFVQAFRKLQSFIVNTEKYITKVADKIPNGAKLAEPIELEYIDTKVMKDIRKLNAKSPKFKADAASLSTRIKEDKVTETVKNFNDVKAVHKSAKAAIPEIKASAESVKVGAKQSNLGCKSGIKMAGKEDKEEVKRLKEEVSNNNKIISLSQKFCSKQVSNCNKAMRACYVAAKELYSGKKSADRKAKRAAKRNATA